MREAWLTAFTTARGEFDFLFVLYAFLASLAVLFLMRQTGLLRRAARWHQWLVRLYYIYIPVVFIAGAVAWSSLATAEKTTLAVVEHARPAVAETTAEYASSAWKVAAAKFRQEPGISPKDLLLYIMRDYSAKLMDGFGSSSFVLKPVAGALQEALAMALTKILEVDLLQKVSDSAKVDRELLRKLWETDIVATLKGGIVCDIFAAQVVRVYKPFYTKIALMFALFLLPVLAETAWSIRRQRRRGVI